MKKSFILQIGAFVATVIGGVLAFASEGAMRKEIAEEYEDKVIEGKEDETAN
jgi:hypothetical protein